MSQRNLDSTYPKIGVTGQPRADVAGPAPSAPAAPSHPGTGGQASGPGNLDKTLSHIHGPLPAGPAKTPGGHGQVWRR